MTALTIFNGNRRDVIWFFVNSLELHESIEIVYVQKMRFCLW